MNKLLEQYKNINKKEHYRLDELNYQNLFSCFSRDNVYDFINNYFDKTGKESIFNLDFFEKYKNKGKHQHTVSLFFLGLSFKEFIKDFCCAQNELIEHFDYIWFLSCLFHDTASVIENDNKILSRGNNQDLDFYLGKYNIKYDVFEHSWKNRRDYNYSKSLVKNYFKYRLDCYNCIDHGILGGYLLYDRLRKNYDNMYKKSSSKNYQKFSYKNLNWNQKHYELYAIAAHTIIEHNIWFASKDKETENLYLKYGLDELINHKKINKKDSPLLFFFGLLDSIEPLKIFNKNNNANDILSLIDITTNNNSISIKWEEKLEENDNFEKWEKNINDLGTWLDVKVLPSKNKKQIEIKFN